jgi:hypothetical protein
VVAAVFLGACLLIPRVLARRFSASR